MFLVLLLALFAHAINGQSEMCNTSRSDFLNDFPECLLAFEGAALNTSIGYEVDSEAVYLICVNETCQTDITDYVESCSSDEVMFQQSATAFGCIQVPDNDTCFDTIVNVEGGFSYLFPNLTSLMQRCGSEYIMGICSDYCVREISMLSDQLECCYSEAVRIITSMTPDQFEAAFSLGLFTRDYFSLCNIKTPMFCEDRVTPPPSACAAAIEVLFAGDDEACASTARLLATNISSGMMPTAECLTRIWRFSNSCNINVTLTPCEGALVDLFGPDDNCARQAAILPRNNTHRISFDEADDAMNIVCGTRGCRGRVNNFVDQCLPASDAQQFEVYILQFGCRINNNDESCFAVQQDGQLDDLADAFMVGGACIEIGFNMCGDQCSSIIRRAVRNNECCVNEFAQAGLVLGGALTRGRTVSGTFQLCGVSNPGRCAEQAEGSFRDGDGNGGDGNDDDDDDDSGASAIAGYTMLVILLTLLPLLTS